MKQQGVLRYTVETIKRSDGITAWAGLPLVLETMRALGLDSVIRERVRVRERERGYSEARKVEALVMLMASGGLHSGGERSSPRLRPRQRRACVQSGLAGQVHEGDARS
jgi:hypothetical protein